MRSSILNKKFLVITASLFFLFLVPQFLFRNKRQPLENIPDNPASRICQKISETEDLYSCLAVVNQNESFCQNFDPKVSLCEKITDQMKKNMCYAEVAIKLSGR